MVQSCREPAQASTKYIAAPTKRYKEHPALLETILSQQVSNNENTHLPPTPPKKKERKKKTTKLFQNFYLNNSGDF